MGPGYTYVDPSFAGWMMLGPVLFLVPLVVLALLAIRMTGER